MTDRREPLILVLGIQEEWAAVQVGKELSEDRDIAQRLRVELARLRKQHHTELAALRHEAAQERAALRRDAAHQLTTVLARLDPNATINDENNPPPPPTDVTEPTKKM
jgi:outer membrane lipopolysaccharide assembly protein LptE/RlpB